MAADAAPLTASRRHCENSDGLRDTGRSGVMSEAAPAILFFCVLRFAFCVLRFAFCVLRCGSGANVLSAPSRVGLSGRGAQIAMSLARNLHTALSIRWQLIL
jgi:hypothetical protein